MLLIAHNNSLVVIPGYVAIVIIVFTYLYLTKAKKSSIGKILNFFKKFSN